MVSYKLTKAIWRTLKTLHISDGRIVSKYGGADDDVRSRTEESKYSLHPTVSYLEKQSDFTANKVKNI